MAARSMLVAVAWCAATIPALAFAQGGAAAPPAASPTQQAGGACECGTPGCTGACECGTAGCAPGHAAHTRAAVAAPLAARGRAAATRGWSTQNIDTSISRSVAPGCEYRAEARGSFRTRDLTGRRPTAPLRDVRMRADAVLSCGGTVVSQEQHTFEVPQLASRAELANMLHTRLVTTLPQTHCAYTATFDFGGGSLRAHDVVSNCGRGGATAAFPGGMMPRGGGMPMQCPMM